MKTIDFLPFADRGWERSLQPREVLKHPIVLGRFCHLQPLDPQGDTLITAERALRALKALAYRPGGLGVV